MNLIKKINPEQLREYVETHPHLVHTSKSVKYPGLQVIKYTRSAFWDGAWDPILVELRGLVVDEDYNVISRPFRKVFNRNEPNGGLLPEDFDRDEEVTAYRKINGFMAAVTFSPKHGGVIVSTTGTTDSDYAKLASKYVIEAIEDGYQPRFGITDIFEVCDPSDRHIIPEETDLYYLGSRNKHTGTLSLHNVDTEGFICRWGDLVKEVKNVRHEGFVAYNKDGLCIKLKSPYYLVNKFFARMKAKKFETGLRTGTLKQTIDEEFYPLVDYLEANKESFLAMDEQERLNFTRNFLEK